MTGMGVSLVLGVVLDALLGEPKRWHPLAAFGRFAHVIETRLHAFGEPLAVRWRGAWAWAIVVIPVVVAAAWLCGVFGWWMDALLLYVALGGRSLAEHARAVMAPLARGDLPAAHAALSMMVSRDTAQLDEQGVAAATVESVLENGNDAVIGTLFWFAVGGGAGAVLFRLANTLDAMWGYRTERFLNFGWAAARADDVLAWLPARLTALSYAALGRWHDALACWRAQAPAHDSPNAGPVMAAGAGALGLRVGGPASYQGETLARPFFGIGAPPLAADIWRAVLLVRRATWLWAALLVVALWARRYWHG